MFCPFVGLLGVLGIPRTPVSFTPGHWLLDVQDNFGFFAPPLYSESVAVIWQQQGLPYMHDAPLVNAKAEKEGNSSFRKTIFFSLVEPNHMSRVDNRDVTNHIISRKQDY